jgi:Rieske Fe-S protein
MTSTRRDFLSRLVALFGGAIGSVLGGLGLLTFVSPAFGRRESGWVRVGEVNPDQIEKPRSVLVSFRRKDGWFSGSGQAVVHLVRNASGEFAALSSTCTHLGCSVRWDARADRFLCPCHGGEYDSTGRVIAGPPPLPLLALETRFEDGVLFIRGDGIGA